MYPWQMCQTLEVIHFFFFNDTATTEIYTLSLHDALPICDSAGNGKPVGETPRLVSASARAARPWSTRPLPLPIVSLPSTRYCAAAFPSTEAARVPLCATGDQANCTSPCSVAELQEAIKR